MPKTFNERFCAWGPGFVRGTGDMRKIKAVAAVHVTYNYSPRAFRKQMLRVYVTTVGMVWVNDGNLYHSPDYGGDKTKPSVTGGWEMVSCGVYC